MEVNTKINGYATTLYHAEHVPHAEAIKRFCAVLRMNPDSEYELETPEFDDRVRLFIKDAGNRRVEISMNPDHLTIREFGNELRRESFDRRVYESAVAFLDCFDIDTFFYQSVSIQARLEPTPEEYDPTFSWQRLFGAADRLPTLLQRNSSQGSFRIDFDPTNDHPSKVALQFRWNQRRPMCAMVEATVQHPNAPISRMTLGRLSSTLKDAEMFVVKKIGRLMHRQPGVADNGRTLVAV